MNATIIVAASSMVLAIFAVVFFLLQNAADGGMTVAYGEMTIPQEDGTSTVSAKYAMDGATKTVSFSAGGYTSMMTEFFDADGSRNIQSYEWDTDGPVLCRFNLQRDFDRFDAMKVSMDSVTVGEGSTISVTDGDFEQTTELNVEYTMIEGAAPADWLPAPIDEDTCWELEKTFEYAADESTDDRMLRELGATAASNLAQSVYSTATCHSTNDGMGWTEGEVCYDVSGCSLSFRGSDDGADWVDNIMGSTYWTNGHNSGKKIHGGFYNQYKSWYDQAWGNVPQSFKNCGSNKIWIGHSLGGAIAAVASLELGGRINTYAGPKPFHSSVGRIQTGARTYHESDPVPQQPFHNRHGCGGSGCSLMKVWEKCTRNAFSASIPYPCSCGWRGCRTCWYNLFDGPCIGWSTQTSMESSISNPLKRPYGSGTGSAIFQNIKELVLGFFTTTGSCASAGGHFHSMSACYQPYGQ
ncbi:hypothetical protein TrRE_jg394 [Triparma retinervis]|uniref:Fungal lipase-type domain-containing protein n=1 Tax=Triparma retinervis TaxID=2557542 RepID=A0A9W6ZI91_9STRA|nr:hypothetical protein TrRE_jg394 [Triparma retinervis]